MNNLGKIILIILWILIAIILIVVLVNVMSSGFRGWNFNILNWNFSRNSNRLINSGNTITQTFDKDLINELNKIGRAHV